MRRRPALLVLCGTVLAAALSWSIIGDSGGRSERQSAGSHEGAPIVVEAPGLGGVTGVSNRVDVIPGEPDPAGETYPPASAGEYLSAYWGSDWERVKLELEQEGFDFERELLVQPPRWEEVESEIEQHFRLSEAQVEAAFSHILKWPEVLTAEFVEARFDIGELAVDDSLLMSLSAEIEPDLLALRALADQYIRELDTALRLKWSREDYARSPLVSVAAMVDEAPIEDGLFSTSLAHSGWTIGLVVTKSDAPEIVRIKESARISRAEIRAKVQSYLNQFK